MTELHDLLAREAERVEVPPGPPFESLAAKARARRTAKWAAAGFGAAMAVTVAIVIPHALRSSSPRLVGPAQETTPAASTFTAPVVTTGQCAGLTVVAVGGSLHQPIKKGPPTNYLSMSIGESLSLVTSGPCATQVEYQPTDGSDVVDMRTFGDQPSAAASPSATSVWVLTAKRQQGSEKLTLELPATPPCVSVGACQMVATTTTITVIVDPPPDKFRVGVSCKAPDLRWSLAWQRDGVMLTGKLTATNTSGHDCDLLMKPRLVPLDTELEPLPVEYIATSELLVGPAVLKAGSSAKSSILWAGWCGPQPGGVVRVTLDNETSVDVLASGPMAPQCPSGRAATDLTSGWFGPLSTPSGVVPSAVMSPASSGYGSPPSGVAPASPYAGGSPSGSSASGSS